MVNCLEYLSNRYNLRGNVKAYSPIFRHVSAKSAPFFIFRTLTQLFEGEMVHLHLIDPVREGRKR